MSEMSQLLELGKQLGPNGLAFLNVLVLYWLNARIDALEKESDERVRDAA